MSLLTFLNQNSGAIQAIFTAVLVAVTIVYGGVYSFSFNCIDEALNESNTITAGPFKIISTQRTSVGGHLEPEWVAKTCKNL